MTKQLMVSQFADAQSLSQMMKIKFNHQKPYTDQLLLSPHIMNFIENTATVLFQERKPSKMQAFQPLPQRKRKPSMSINSIITKKLFQRVSPRVQLLIRKN